MQFAEMIAFFGDGSDGNVTISTETDTVGTLIVSGKLQRDACFNNLKFASGGKLYTNGFRIFVRYNLDLSQASTGAIYYNGLPGTKGTDWRSGGPAVAVSSPAQPSAGTLGGPSIGGTSGKGVNAKSAGAAAAAMSNITGNGGQGGASGKGGKSTSNAGAPSVASGTVSGLKFKNYTTTFLKLTTLLVGGGGGAGGGGGGGISYTYSAGAGGSGGNGAGVIAIYADTIIRGSAVGIIQAIGGDGGQSGGGGTNAGAGGGGGGGGGGYIYIFCRARYGTLNPSAVDVSGGKGGDGGYAMGNGWKGDGGTGGASGNIFLMVTGESISKEYNGSAGSAGTAGALGGTVMSADGVGGAGHTLRGEL